MSFSIAYDVTSGLLRYYTKSMENREHADARDVIQTTKTEIVSVLVSTLNDDGCGETADF